MKAHPVPAVLRWLNESNSNELYLSVITIAEIAYGLQILPEGKRRQTLSARFDQFIDRGFSQRVLVFNQSAAFTYGEIMAMTRSLGRPMSDPDGQIAAIAKTHEMSLATRNVSDFDETGLALINPWE